MKKTFKSLLSIFLAVFMVASLMVIPSSAAGINKSSITVTKGYQMSLKFSGSSSVTWSTGDKSIATVSSSGKVVGKAPGSTYVYAKANGKTYKCKVNVVAAKITASNSEVELDEKGDSQIVTLTVKGSHSGLTVGTTDRSVAKASWVKPVEWDGNKIKIKITAQGKGTARIKVYLKKYSSTCYKYIDVNVGDSLYEDDDTDSNMSILPYSKKVTVNAGNTATLQVYSNDLSNLGYSVTDSRIATVSAGNSSGNNRNYSIRGITAGSTTVRFYDKTNTKKYVDVTVVVGSNAEYYQFYTTEPVSKIASTDQLLKVQVGYTYYYMLVPANYDPANTNTLIAQKFNKYEYYKVYQNRPGRLAATDSYKEFTHTNSRYNYGQRYMLIPANSDEVKVNTAIAQYNNRYEYYTVYNANPAVQDNWDKVTTWTVNDSVTGQPITRYMLIPYYSYDQDRIDDIINKDKNSNNVYTYYSVYSTYPVINTQTDQVVTYTKNGSWRYMVVPKTGFDILKRNDAIQKDTGVFEYYVMYSYAPTADPSKGEYIRSAQYGGKYIYVLCNYPQGSPEDGLGWAGLSTKAPTGT